MPNKKNIWFYLQIQWFVNLKRYNFELNISLIMIFIPSNCVQFLSKKFSHIIENNEDIWEIKWISCISIIYSIWDSEEHIMEDSKYKKVTNIRIFKIDI